MTRDDLRAAVLAADDITIEPVATPEWPAVNGQLHVRTMSGTQRDRYLNSIRQTIGEGAAATVTVTMDEIGAKLAAATLCDASGALLFTVADVTALGAKHYAALERVTAASARLNGLDEQAAAAAKNDSASGTATGASNTV